MLRDIINECIREYIKESEYNYHIGNIKDINNIQPHYSDNKYRMRGRDTGHFGSGIYFSTYENRYKNDSDNDNPQFIQIGKNIYRVDFDIYKNLYRVTSERHGDMLYNTMKNLNQFYNKIEYGNFDCRKNYLIIKRNSQALKLNCPSYKQLYNMANDLINNGDDIRSFSTLFMEYNGYNGVNVSNIYKYDNTLHGSVIYDLSKIDKDSIQKVNLDYKYLPYVDSSVATSNELEDAEYDVLRNKSNFQLYKLRNLSEEEKFRLLKISDYILEDLYMMKYEFSEKYIQRYLRIIYNKIKKDAIKNTNVLYTNKNIEFLYKNKAFYFVNIYPINNSSTYGSILLSFINLALFEDDSSEIIKNILNNLNRELTYFEDEILSKWLKNNNEIKKLTTENRFMKGYHASNADFDKFDIGYINSGNKGQAYGYGIYISLDEKSVENYGKIKYTVEIPSDNKLYLNNFEILDIKFMEKVIKKFYNYLLKNDTENLYDGYEIGLKEELIEAFKPMNGLDLYGTISSYLGSDKEASEFCYKYLKKIGIKYKSYDNINIVMFNSNDINIIGKK